MAFNPVQFGATPAQTPTASFNPSQFGAIQTQATVQTQPQQPQQSLSDSIWGGLASLGKGAANLIAGGASDLGTHLGEAAAVGTGKLVTAVTGNPALESKVTARLQQPQTNLFGAPLKPIQPGLGGVEQIGGDALKTGASLGAAAFAPTTLGGSIAAGAGIGAAQGAGQAMQNTTSPSGVLAQGAIGAGIGGATAGVISGFGHLIGAVGDKIMTSVIKPSRADVADGFNIQTLKDYNLGGSLNTTLEKTQNAMNGLTSQLHEKLGASTNTINLNDVADQTIKDLTDTSKLKGFGANTKIANALEQLKQEIGVVQEGSNGLSIPDAQVVKQAAGGFGAWQFGKPDPESKAQEIVYTMFYNKLKAAIEQSSPDGVKEINQQLSKLIPVANAVIRRLPVAERSNGISLNEMIGLVGSTAHPAALGPTIIDAISKSGVAGSLLSKFGPAASRLAIPASYLTGATAAQTQSNQPEPISQ